MKTFNLKKTLVQKSKKDQQNDISLKLKLLGIQEIKLMIMLSKQLYITMIHL